MKQHEKREDLAGEHVFGDAGQIILFVIFLAVWITDSFFMRYSTFLSGYISLWVKIPFAIAVLCIGGYLAKTSHDIIFKEIRKEPSVVDRGVFGRVRHPLYLAAILFYLGMLLFTFSIIAGIVFIMIIVFYNYIARYEERLLIEKFGEEYEEYMKRVPRWIPGSGSS
ncbi:MAG: isoprenylcysteine carboxylmethyltransferase family protein [Deltaproteobacteria bacterium]|nr:isoprenylcysteine carboxylmethyltransferase family protein [Deltaproteobacteria bacterium]